MLACLLDGCMRVFELQSGALSLSLSLPLPFSYIYPSDRPSDQPRAPRRPLSLSETQKEARLSLLLSLSLRALSLSVCLFPESEAAGGRASTPEPFVRIVGVRRARARPSLPLRTSHYNRSTLARPTSATDRRPPSTVTASATPTLLFLPPSPSPERSVGRSDGRAGPPGFP